MPTLRIAESDDRMRDVCAPRIIAGVNLFIFNALSLDRLI